MTGPVYCRRCGKELINRRQKFHTECRALDKVERVADVRTKQQAKIDRIKCPCCGVRLGDHGHSVTRQDTQGETVAEMDDGFGIRG